MNFLCTTAAWLCLLSLLLCHTGISAADADKEEDEELRKGIEQGEAQLTKLATTLKGVSAGGDTNVFKQIGSFADEATAFVKAAAQVKTLKEKQAIIQEGLERRSVWLETLTKLHGGSQGADQVEVEDAAEAEPVAEVEDAAASMQSVLDLAKEVQNIAALKEVSGGADREAILEKLVELQSKIKDMEAQSSSQTAGLDPELIKALAGAAEEAAPAAKEAMPKMTEEELAQAGRLVQKATRDGVMSMIEKFLERLEDQPDAAAQILNWGDKVGATVLHWSVFYQSEAHLDILKKFLDTPGINPNAVDKRGRTACHLACFKKNVLALKELMKDRSGGMCDPTATDGSGQNCLHMAAERGDADLLKVLAQAGKIRKDTVDVATGPEYTDEENVSVTPLWLAVKSGSVESVRILVEGGADAKQGLIGSDNNGGPTSSLALAARSLETYGEILEGVDPENAASTKKDNGRKAEL